MSFYIVHIPDDAMQRDGGDSVYDVTTALADFYRVREIDVKGMPIEPAEALAAGWCDACPDCRQCSGDRSSCECYQHDNPARSDR